MTNPPKLEAPGAGIPTIERLVAKYWLLRRYYKSTDWDKSLGFFDHIGKKIIDVVSPLNAEKLGTPVLIDRFPGIEDSSRYWSVAMTVEHLIIVGDKMSEQIVALTNGHMPSGMVNTAAVKPAGKLDPGATRTEFEAYLARYRKRVTEEVGDRNSKLTFRHPWFHEMTAYQWHCLAGVHQNLHYKQILAIIKGL